MRRLRRLLATLVALVAVAVVVGEQVLGEGDGSRPADRPSARVAGIPLPDDARSGSVERVVDGDTVVLEELGSSRLIGIDTPEVHGGVECYGREASAWVKERLPPDTVVTYVLGEDERDRYGRALVYLWLDGRSLNGALAAEGYATPLTIAPNDEYAEQFTRLARAARRAERGLWAPGACG